MSYNMQPVQQTSTLQKVAVIVPAFLVGMVGAMALTAPQQVAVQHRVLPQAGMVAGAVAAGMMSTAPAMALNDIAMTNDMDKRAGVMITYEARDSALSQDVRSGFADRDPAFAKTRLTESVARLGNVGMPLASARHPLLLRVGRCTGESSCLPALALLLRVFQCTSWRTQ